uniref:Glutathione peroxidase n=1 Tax=Rhabditophanes sp. KR3021 TaxID=114890 RepID=A0AC35UE08_9BILA
MSQQNSIYDFKVEDANGQEVSLDKYKGKVVIIVNVASACGFADSNYTQFKEMLEQYKDKGFAVACFPCNQFNSQEKECALDIVGNMKQKYNIEPDFYGKIDVNGSNAAPLYNFLKKEQGGFLVDAIKWNFTKFLIDKNGKVIKRYAPTTEPKSMTKDIEALF